MFQISISLLVWSAVSRLHSASAAPQSYGHTLFDTVRHGVGEFGYARLKSMSELCFASSQTDVRPRNCSRPFSGLLGEQLLTTSTECEDCLESCALESLPRATNIAYALLVNIYNLTECADFRFCFGSCFRLATVSAKNSWLQFSEESCIRGNIRHKTHRPMFDD